MRHTCRIPIDDNEDRRNFCREDVVFFKLIDYIYVMSDLHGCYYFYKAMLEKINLSKTDELYILGDVIDRGGDGIKILQDIMKLQKNGYNVTLLMGNHEYIAGQILSVFNLPLTIDIAIGEELQELLNMWILDGGKPTLRDFVRLTEAEQVEIFEFLQSLPLFFEITVNKKDYVLVHAGFGNFSKTKPLNSYEANDILFKRNDIDTQYFDNKTVITGHTPTIFYGEAHAGKILIGDGLIFLDCGAVYEQCGVLGCLRLNDFQEIYIEGYTI